MHTLRPTRKTNALFPGGVIASLADDGKPEVNFPISDDSEAYL